jgi:hypothetical protein
MLDWHKEMLSHLAMIVSKQYLCIPKQFDKMEIALRTAYSDEFSLNKERSSHNDLTDALRLACNEINLHQHYFLMNYLVSFSLFLICLFSHILGSNRG